MGYSAGSVGGGGRGGRLARTCSLGASLEDCPLFLLDIRPLRPDLGFKSMSSSSVSWLVSIRATISFGEWAAEKRLRSEPESESSTGLVDTSPFLLKWKWSISASRDKCVESIPSPGTVGKSGFISHTKHIAEATNMDLFHSWLITCTIWFSKFENKIVYLGAVKFKTRLRNTFNLHSNSTLRPRSVVSQSISKEE